MTNVNKLIQAIDKYLEQSNQSLITPVEANSLLERLGLLNDSSTRKGLPLRKLLRAGEIPHAYQIGGKGSKWFIPHSKKRK
jgi:hypothetical protein